MSSVRNETYRSEPFPQQSIEQKAIPRTQHQSNPLPWSIWKNTHRIKSASASRFSSLLGLFLLSNLLQRGDERKGGAQQEQEDDKMPSVTL